MKKSIFPCLAALVFMTAGCQAKKEEPQTTGARTSFGQAVEKAHGVSDISDRRNEDLKKQANALKGE